VCDPLLTRAIPERFRDEQLIIKCYRNKALLYFILNVKLIITRKRLSVRLSIDKDGFLAIVGFRLTDVSVNSTFVEELLHRAVSALGGR